MSPTDYMFLCFASPFLVIVGILVWHVASTVTKVVELVVGRKKNVDGY